MQIEYERITFYKKNKEKQLALICCYTQTHRESVPRGTRHLSCFFTDCRINEACQSKFGEKWTEKTTQNAQRTFILSPPKVRRDRRRGQRNGPLLRPNMHERYHFVRFASSSCILRPMEQWRVGPKNMPRRLSPIHPPRVNFVVI